MGKTQREGQPVPESLTPFLAPLEAVQNLLSALDDKGVIIGGIAASLLGAPRFTADVDLVVLLDPGEFSRLLREANAQGMQPRIDDAEAFARRNRVLLLRHTTSGIDIDVSLGVLPFEVEMVERSRPLKLSGLKLRLPTPEDLIILKAVAHRPQDMLDIQAVLANHPALDKERIRYWVSQFSEALEMPELWIDLAPHLE